MITMDLRDVLRDILGSLRVQYLLLKRGCSSLEASQLDFQFRSQLYEEYDYPAFHLKMHCYLCSLLTEALHLNEHEAARWLAKDETDSVKWLPADLLVLEALKDGKH